MSSHSSSQNLTFSPVPTFQTMFELNQLSPWSEILTFVKSFHHLEVYMFLFGIGEFVSLHEPYFDSRTSFQSHVCGESILHNHLANSALLNKSILLIPSPPSFSALQMFSQLVQAIFLPSAPHPHKNFLCNFVISLHTPIGALKKDRKNSGMTLMTDFKDKLFPRRTCSSPSIPKVSF